jgi:hypothetical protein
MLPCPSETENKRQDQKRQTTQKDLKKGRTKILLPPRQLFRLLLLLMLLRVKLVLALPLLLLLLLLQMLLLQLLLSHDPNSSSSSSSSSNNNRVEGRHPNRKQRRRHRWLGSAKCWWGLLGGGRGRRACYQSHLKGAST